VDSFQKKKKPKPTRRKEKKLFEFQHLSSEKLKPLSNGEES